jgi:hypothetical protein
MKFHKNEIAINYSFYDVLILNETNKTILKSMQELRSRCIEPGIYIKHIFEWLKYFKLNQLYMIDGQLLKSKPHQCLNNLQRDFMKLDTFLDYEPLLKYNKKKGFYCPIIDTKKNLTKCLGSSKGRKYPLIDPKSKEYLKNLYNDANLKLFNFLTAKSIEVPIWLKDIFELNKN